MPLDAFIRYVPLLAEFPVKTFKVPIVLLAIALTLNTPVCCRDFIGHRLAGNGCKTVTGFDKPDIGPRILYQCTPNA